MFVLFPKDVRHILNRTEFNESLKTGRKAEASMKKYAFLQVWQQLIINATKPVAGPTPEELPEASFGVSTMLANHHQAGLMNLAASTGPNTHSLKKA